MIDIVERLRHCSENCGDEYLHELSGRAADTITALRARVETLEGALTKAHNGLKAGVDEYASRDMHGNIVPGDEQYPWVKSMQIGLDAVRAALGDTHE